jgi:hypothetical protein
MENNFKTDADADYPAMSVVITKTVDEIIL